MYFFCFIHLYMIPNFEKIFTEYRNIFNHDLVQKKLEYKKKYERTV